MSSGEVYQASSVSASIARATAVALAQHWMNVKQASQRGETLILAIQSSKNFYVLPLFDKCSRIALLTSQLFSFSKYMAIHFLTNYNYETSIFLVFIHKNDNVIFPMSRIKQFFILHNLINHCVLLIMDEANCYLKTFLFLILINMCGHFSAVFCIGLKHLLLMLLLFLCLQNSVFNGVIFLFIFFFFKDLH